jgi:1-acyl-sn-glycerol-3-phosphate acyltransferase
VPEQQAQVISFAEQRAARESRGPAGSRVRCAGTTVDGRPCRNYAVEDGRCRVHALQSSPASTQPATTPSDDPTAARDRSAQTARATAGGRRRSGRSRTRPAGGARETVTAGGAPTGAGRHDEAYRRAARAVADRGLGTAIDGFGALQELVGDQWTDQLRDGFAFARRRLTGDYHIDDFGFDEDLATHVMMPLLRPLHRTYWRVASHGIQHLPLDHGALLVANHAGTLPADALITRYDVFERTGRHARELGADLVFRLPVVGELARKTGATLAAGDDALRLLRSGELVAVWPEGFKGLGKPWKDRYKLQRFGRGGFVATALRAQAPIIPTAIVGSEEIYPMLFDLRVVARVLGFPYFPVVPQMFLLPVLGPFALLPLPSKWIIEYGEPIATDDAGAEVADDPMAVFDLSDLVRQTIQDMLYRNLMGRRSVFL